MTEEFWFCNIFSKIKDLKLEMNEKIKALSDEQGNQEFIANESAKIQAQYAEKIAKLQED